MWIQVRSMDGLKRAQIDDLSKLTKVEELRERLVEPFDATPDRQRLFYRGKQLEDGHSLFDYDVGLNDIIQLMVRPLPSTEGRNGTVATTNGTVATTNGTVATTNGTETVNDGDTEDVSEGEDTVMDEVNGSEEVNGTEEQLGLYKVSEKIDARDLRMGAWFEAEVVKVTAETSPTSNGTAVNGHTSSNGTGVNGHTSNGSAEQTIYYHVKFDDYNEEEITRLTSADIRPRARYRLQWDQLVEGNRVMVNYNSDLPKERGFWYDAIITRKNDGKRELYGKLVLGETTDASEEIKVKFIDEVFRIETRTSAGEEGAADGEAVTRIKKPDCDRCKDNPRRKCKFCACSVCGGKESPDKQILCDECDMAYHLWCLEPKLKTVPDGDDWYCPSCKTDSTEVIGAGEKMRMTKKKAGMMSNKGSCNRDWGKGMACVGRTKKCTIVPSNHFGPIPGIPVGTAWKFRVQASEDGVHRPHVAGIHGRENEGAYSIVLSGGYEDDVDNGEEFTYSGSGGRDLSGNKRTAKQSMDQKLTAMNRALARNCDAPIDDKKGAVGKDWRKGKPVRVIRNHKGSKVSEFAPTEGNRYDGIYKIVKYWPEKGITGFIVWKYLIRRDDPSPAPWTPEGKKEVARLGLIMQYPEGYLEAKKAQAEDLEEEKPKKGKKRRASEATNGSTPPSKQPRYELTKHQKTLIKGDLPNKKVWMGLTSGGKSKAAEGLLARIQEAFTCIVCQEVVYQPVTTSCAHNMCKTCLSRSFKAEVTTCPSCRHELGKDYQLTVNKSLQEALLDLFPGYNGGR